MVPYSGAPSRCCILHAILHAILGVFLGVFLGAILPDSRTGTMILLI